MSRSSLYVFFSLVGLSVAFVVISALVILSRGKNQALLRKKLRIGALILSLTGFATVGSINCVSCYSPAMSDNVSFENLNQDYAVVVDRSVSSTISGEITSRSASEFSFRVLDASEIVHQSDDIEALDGAFDESSEEFEFELDAAIPAGEYTLYFYTVSADQQDDDDSYVRSSVRLVVQ